MRKFLAASAIALTACFPLPVNADITVDIGTNRPMTNPYAVTFSDGATISLYEFLGGHQVGLRSVFQNTNASDFSFSNNGIDNLGLRVDWTNAKVVVDFGSDFGDSGDGIVSDTDFALTITRLNGSSNWYEFGYRDLAGTGSAVTDGAISSYLKTISNYSAADPRLEIRTVLGR